MAGHVLLFGRLQDAFGAPNIPLPEGVATVAALRTRLIELHPEMAATLSARTVRVVLTTRNAAGEIKLSGEAVIALDA